MNDETARPSARGSARRGAMGRDHLVHGEGGAMGVVTTDMVLRYIQRVYRVEQDEIRTARPAVDRPVYLVETIRGVRYEIPEAWIMAAEGVV